MDDLLSLRPDSWTRQISARLRFFQRRRICEDLRVSGKEAPKGILIFLIADIRGYTTFTQERGDEAAAKLAGKFAKVTREGVEAHGGELIELRGDEALCVFTSPRAALRAAADLQMVYRDEAAIHPALAMQVGIGLDAGEAVPVEGGYRGGALNLAARLCSRAVGGEVLVSQGVAHLARAVDGIELVQQGELELKGLSDSVRVFRLLADRPVMAAPSTGSNTLPSALLAVTPMIGREENVRRLCWIWRLARRGNGRVVAVVGPSGIGKTRLAAEIAAQVVSDGGSARYASFEASHENVQSWLVDGVLPGLIVLDRLEHANAEDLRILSEALIRARSTTMLVVLLVDDQRISGEQLTIVNQLAGSEEAIIRPSRLNVEQMRQVAAFYAGAAASAVPRDLLSETGGIPRKVHEEVGRWAYVQATRRLGTLANSAATERSDLRAVEADLAGKVVDLQQVLEQTRLFGLVAGSDAFNTSQSPYRGLAAFGADDAEFFFGRERLVAELVSRLAGASLLGVVGPSGSGKSSAVGAGLVPALGAGVLPGSDRWTIASLRPGEHPLRELDRSLWSALPRPVLERMTGTDVSLAAVGALLGDEERVLVVVDAFEEVYTTCIDERERAAFIKALVDAADDLGAKVVVVLAIRADYYGRCAADPKLAGLLAANHVLLGPMSADEYRRAIVQPALRVGVHIEPELVDDLVTEVIGEPGALPLLSTTLFELWNRRDGRTIPRRAYLATGGVRGAVARLADEVYGGFDATEQRIAQGVLLRLAGTGEGDTAVRRRVLLSEFDVERQPDVAEVLDVLTTRRLVTVSDGSVEVAHEALLREWPRLQGWMEEDREGRQLRQHLTAASREWDDRGRDPGELYRGARLSAALDWTMDHNLELNELERHFVAVSRAQSQVELTRHRRQNRRLRGLLAGLAALLIVAVAAGGIALVQRQSANAAARVALARQLGAEALTDPQIDQAMLLARQAVLFDDDTETEGTLLATLVRSPAVLSTFTVPIQVRPMQLALSSDAVTLAVSDNSGDIRFYDTRTRQESHPPLIGSTAGLPDAYGGPYFFAVRNGVVGSASGLALDVFNAQTMSQVRTLPLNPLFTKAATGPMDPLFASPDGTTVFFAWTLINPDGSDGAAYLDSWDVTTGQHRVIPLGSDGMNGAAWIPGHQQVMVVTDTAVITLDGDTLLPVRSMPIDLGSTYVAISPFGDELAVRSGQNDQPGDTFSIVNVASGSRIPVAGSHAGPIDSMAFTPGGGTIITTGDDGDVIVWDVATAAPIETITGHAGPSLGQALSADGKTLYTSGLDGAIFACDLIGSRRFGRPFSVFPAGSALASEFPKPALAIAPDGSRFATRIGPGRIGIYYVASFQIDTSFSTSSGDVISLAWSSDQELGVGTVQGIELWDVHSQPRLVRSLGGVSGSVDAIAFSANGSAVAAVTDVPPPPSSDDPDTGWLGVWDSVSGDLRATTRLAVNGWSLSFTPDGDQLGVGLGDGTVVIVAARSLAPVLTVHPEGQGATNAVAFLHDGVLLTGSYGGIVQEWNPDTGAQVNHALLAEAAPVSSLAVAPLSGDFATSGGSSGGVSIWDDKSLQQFGAAFPGGAGQWGNAQYTPNGANIVVMYSNGMGAIWPVSLSAWMDHACAVAQRNFTQEEWNQFVPNQPYAQTCPDFSSG